MTDSDQNKSTGTVHRSAQRRLSTSSDTGCGACPRELDLEAQCIKLEKQILELQNSLTDLHSTKRRLEKQVGEKADEILQKNQQYQHYQNELINFAKHTVRRLENERRKISRELHDNVAQGLVTIKLFLENKLTLMGEAEDSSLFSIESILEITQDNLNEIRRIVNYLRPKMLDDIGLLATIQWHWQKIQSRMPDLALKIKLAVTESDIPQNLKLMIYRIIQEASNNIERRGLATRIEFELKREDQTLTLKICDYGKGFDIKALPLELERNPGLTSMKEYTELSEGRFSLQFSQTKGTSIEVAWDLVNQRND